LKPLNVIGTRPPQGPEQSQLAVVEVAIDYGDRVDWSAVFIHEVRDGKIARATAYWAQPFEAAASRAEWVQHMDGEPPDGCGCRPSINGLRVG
jgi:hypothetical protein